MNDKKEKEGNLPNPGIFEGIPWEIPDEFSKVTGAKVVPARTFVLRYGDSRKIIIKTSIEQARLIELSTKNFQALERVSMIERHSKRSNTTSPAFYRIRIMGRLDPKWSDYLQGMKVSVVEEKEGAVFSELTGLLPDQAALMGVQQLCNLGTCLISVDCTSIVSRNE